MDSRPVRSHFVEERAVGARSDNRLIHGDNLAAMLALRRSMAGKFRCAYLDPPFNTGRSFVEYKDAKTAEDWASSMRARIEALAPLIADDGAVFVEIDDTSLAALTIILDAVFGAENRISTVTIVRSASTGHKAINRGPVHVSDFLLVYAKAKKKMAVSPAGSRRRAFDRAYASWLDNPDDEPATWTFRTLRAAAGTNERTAFALAHPRHVIRFAQPRYEAIALAARKVVDRSRAEPARVFVHERPGLAPFIVRGGNRILFLADKVRVIDGEPRIVEPLTNVWDDVPFQGIAREGGVVFSRNKKPERLVARVLEMSTEPGDWVLDPFLGSGTTAAVAHKMGRQWIGIESGDHARTLAEPRLRRVVEGSDPTGVTSVYSFAGGGGFRVATLA